MYLIRYIYHFIFTPFYKMGWPVAFNTGSRFRNPRYISLGKRVFLGRNTLVQCPDEHKDFGLEKPKLIIGNRVTINDGSMVNAAKLVHIKDHVKIAQHCYIGDNSHKYTDVNIPIRYQGIDKVKPIIIDEGAWIGSKVTISPGVKIGKNAVIGANSVVTNDIPAFSVAVGIPAKVIKLYNKETDTWERVQ
jgi:acetyltransferase-like isoleucine patch superfamily enzyme